LLYLFVPLCKAELYRVKKEFDKAEPLYLEAVSILEEFYGPDDVRWEIISLSFEFWCYLINTIVPKLHLFMITHNLAENPSHFWKLAEFSGTF